MPYRIVLTENAVADFNGLDARLRATVRDSLRLHLAHEPAKESRSRIKKVRDLRHPQFRLRIGEIGVFYDVTETDVVIIAIISKEKTIEWLKEHATR